jgi:hypothetical protein
MILAALWLGCAGPNGPGRSSRDALAAEANALTDALTAAPPVAADTLRVRLAFGARADLDLYVTDPTQETAYFANSPTKLGGVLEEDLRCEAPAPRVETLRLTPAAAGRYRVGVDYPEACGDDRGAVAFVVFLERGPRREERRGSIRPGEFLAIVLEADLE